MIFTVSYLHLLPSCGPNQSSELLQDRVREIEVMLGMVLRLPEGSGKKARLEAFKGAVDSMIENAEQKGLSGFKEVDSRYLQVGAYVSMRLCV